LEFAVCGTKVFSCAIAEFNPSFCDGAAVWQFHRNDSAAEPIAHFVYRTKCACVIVKLCDEFVARYTVHIKPGIPQRFTHFGNQRVARLMTHQIVDGLQRIQV